VTERSHWRLQLWNGGMNRGTTRDDDAHPQIPRRKVALPANNHCPDCAIEK
jgi:hypothetical protein